jgi:hypothetical protein
MPIVRHWSREMLRVQGLDAHGSLVGRMLLRVGLPVCGFLGRRLIHKVVA